MVVSRGLIIMVVSSSAKEFPQEVGISSDALVNKFLGFLQKGETRRSTAARPPRDAAGGEYGTHHQQNHAAVAAGFSGAIQSPPEGIGLFSSKRRSSLASEETQNGVVPSEVTAAASSGLLTTAEEAPEDSPSAALQLASVWPQGEPQKGTPEGNNPVWNQAAAFARETNPELYDTVFAWSCQYTSKDFRTI